MRHVEIGMILVTAAGTAWAQIHHHITDRRHRAGHTKGEPWAKDE